MTTSDCAVLEALQKRREAFEHKVFIGSISRGLLVRITYQMRRKSACNSVQKYAGFLRRIRKAIILKSPPQKHQ